MTVIINFGIAIAGVYITVLSKSCQSEIVCRLPCSKNLGYAAVGTKLSLYLPIPFVNLKSSMLPEMCPDTSVSAQIDILFAEIVISVFVLMY